MGRQLFEIFNCIKMTVNGFFILRSSNLERLKLIKVYNLHIHCFISYSNQKKNIKDSNKKKYSNKKIYVL